jgi:hypothetical protein
VTLPLRPHHLLCALGYRGKGYSDAFTANMTALVTHGLHEDPATVVEITPGLDAICAPCPSNLGQVCTKQDQIAALDARHADRLGLRAGDRMTWAQARDLIRRRVAPGDLGQLCAGCQWLDLGLCESALADLHNTPQDASAS